MIDQFIASDFC